MGQGCRDKNKREAHQDGLGHDHDAPPVEPIGGRATDEGQDHEGNDAEESEESDFEGRIRQDEQVPGEGNALHLAADGADKLA